MQHLVVMADIVCKFHQMFINASRVTAYTECSSSGFIVPELVCVCVSLCVCSVWVCTGMGVFKCTGGYLGDRCEERCDCLNGGECLRKGSLSICVCPIGIFFLIILTLSFLSLSSIL
ncbi:hypothetical protein LOAG_11272 [Loa loa]|uniref:Uncharacterized protein n=1 Tax=Loa loa TaxID=7209 RepID=A0A1S0TNB0_LOALO|nr:hypothetical protein LOAG_11272 [Loa loa]EFO17228.1 hypothetical protein LOAG_11272 [Loa loa]